MPQETKEIKGKPLFRELTFTREAVNVDSRTVTLAFSSEEPYLRWFGYEILDHSVDSVMLGRLMDGGPLLLNHDTESQIGVVESVEIGADRIGRAVVRFGKGRLADEIFNDVVDGIRRKVSVGYIPHDMILVGKQGNDDTYRVTKWEPLEISIVPIPADNSVGVGRAVEDIILEQKGKKMTTEPNVAPQQTAPTTVDVRQVETDARKNEMKRFEDLMTVGRKFPELGGESLAQELYLQGKNVSDLNAALLERKGTATPQSPLIGMEAKDLRRYSFMNVIRAVANPNDRAAQEGAKFEMELSQEACKKLGKSARGIVVPFDVLVTPAKRDLVVGTSTAGGHTVSTDLLAGSFIEVLRKRMALVRMGARSLTGLVGNIAIPRQTSATTAYWVAESGSPTESQPAFDQVTMSPKTVGAYVDISRKLLLQSSVDIEAMVRDDLARVLALEIDRVSLYGTGSSNQPLGLKATTNLNTVNFAAMAPTWAEIISMETQVAADNADVETMAYLVNARARGTLKGVEKASSTGQFVWENGGTVNGYRAEVSNQVEGDGSTTEDYWFGDWSQAMIGYWGGLDIIMDTSTGSTSGTVRIVGLQDVDVAFRHPESFCRGANTL